MGRLGKIVKISDVIKENGAKLIRVMIDMGGGISNNIEGDQYNTPGIDSKPLINDVAILESTNESRGNSGVISGVVDFTSEKKAEDGETRMYSRDANGTPVAEVYCKDDGEVVTANDNITSVIRADGSGEISNSSGSIKLLASGNIDLNGVIIDTSGNITSPGTIDGTTITGSVDVIADTISGKSHNHTGALTGTNNAPSAAFTSVPTP